jgi:hypothetical protein
VRGTRKGTEYWDGSHRKDQAIANIIQREIDESLSGQFERHATPEERKRRTRREKRRAKV